MRHHTIPIVFAVLLSVISAGLGITYVRLRMQLFSPTSYEECTTSQGSLIQESYPAVCVTKSGARFTQPLTDEEKQSLAPPDETEDWETYKNVDYGFAIKYPNDWSIEETFISDAVSAFTASHKPLLLFITDNLGNKKIYIDPELPLSTGKVSTRGNRMIAERNVDYWMYGESTTHFSNFKIDKLPHFSIDTYESSPKIDQILATFQFLPED